jgi:hypothetical protein
MLQLSTAHTRPEELPISNASVLQRGAAAGLLVAWQCLAAAYLAQML